MNQKNRRAGKRADRSGGNPPTSLAAASSDVETLFATALGHHQSGQLAAAEESDRRILAVAPDHAKTLHHLGILAHQAGRSDAAVELIERAIASDRGVPEFHTNLGVALEALKRWDAAAAHYRTAIALRPDHVRAHLNLANVLIAQSKLDEAEAMIRRAIVLDPGFPDAPFNLGVMLARRHRFDDAIAQFRNVLRLKPDHAAAHSNLRSAYVAIGDIEQAAHHGRQALALDPRNHQEAASLGLISLMQGDAKQALQLALHCLDGEETQQARHLFARAGRYAAVDTPRFRELVRRALAERWGRPRHLMGPAINLIKTNGAIRAAIERQGAAWPAILSIPQLCGATGFAAIADDLMLRELMRAAPICDGELEQLLTALRRGVLDLAADEAALADQTLQFACALAQLCFSNEYIYALSAEERDRAAALGARLAAAVADGRDVPALWIAAVGAYVPLHTLGSADLFVRRAWPAPVAAVVRQQITEPNAQRDLRAELPRLTMIEDATSIAVQRQYEENPFPRWTAMEATVQPSPLDAFMTAKFRYVPYKPLGKDRIDVLVAGCGTGQIAIEAARTFAGADVLAVDLSTASLGYAMYKTRELGLANIRYGVADILKLDTLGRSFDVIDASGVLHHLADPMAAWRLLLSLLRPGGVMSVGLYSELARDFVVRARAFIAERGYQPTPDGIRRCRQEMAQSDDPLLMAATERADFFSMSECRDLLFHVEEHRLTLPQIAAFIDEAKLTFLGFDADTHLLKQYGSRFPADKSKTDLACWHHFEIENPRSFAGMYQFWIQKP